MGIRFSADEVFEIAIQIETDGAEFYRKAASLQSEPDNKKFLDGLSKMEEQHKKTFQEMHDSFSGGMREQLVFDPDNLEILYLQAIASSHGGEGSPSVAQSLTGDESMEDIIRIALDLENKSILYYVGVREIVKAPHEKDKIDTIIGEERKHVAQLTKVLNETI